MRTIQIEHVDAVNDLDRIITVEGIDAFIIGPMDLSASAGKLGQFRDPVGGSWTKVPRSST